jgi:hypothetical protein
MPVQGTSEERPSELPSAGLIRPIKRRIVTDAVFLGPWDGTLRYLSDFRQRRSLFGQTPATLDAPSARALKVTLAPSLDGRVADDPAWEMVPPLTDFWQTAPEAGQPASERTEVRIAYTEDALYFGVTLYDRSAEGLTALRLAARLPARRRRQLPHPPRHLQGPAERLRVRHQPGRPRVRRAGHRRGRPLGGRRRRLEAANRVAPAAASI